MADPLQARGERFEQSLVIEAPPATVFDCFFSPEALRAWWQAVRSVTTPVPFGAYAIEWATTPYRDDVLGALGGVFHGTVVDVSAGRHFYIADAWWIPPTGHPIGPMGLQVTCEDARGGCRLNVKQDGYEASPRWLRYYAVTARGWQVSLLALKRYAETARRQSLKIPEAPAAPAPLPPATPAPAPVVAASPEPEPDSSETAITSTAFSDLMNAEDSEAPTEPKD